MKVSVPLAKNILAPTYTTPSPSFTPFPLLSYPTLTMDNGSGTLIKSNKKMNDIMKIVKALEDSGILLKGITKTIENETNEQKAGILGMLLGTLVDSLLGNMG